MRNTIIHELGHNLSLHHGGNVFCNGKPNYNSLMNYDYQFRGVDVDCDRRPDGIDNLGYSHGDRTFLQQGFLNEAQGVCRADHPKHRAIDWNANGIIDAAPVSYPGEFSFSPGCAGVATSADHDDYAALRLKPTTPANGGAPLLPTEDSGACPPLPATKEN